MFKKSAIAFSTLVAALSLSANADTVSFSDSIADTVAAWSGNMHLSLFDPSLGTLNSVKITLSGHVSGTASLENLAGDPASIDITMKSTIRLKNPDGTTTLVQVAPNYNPTISLGMFDGSDDYAGSSGIVITAVSASATNFSTLFSGLGTYKGVGSLTLPITAGATTGYSSDAGSASTNFVLLAGADATIEYDYTPLSGVPEPSTWMTGMALLGTCGLSLRSRRNKVQA